MWCAVLVVMIFFGLAVRRVLSSRPFGVPILLLYGFSSGLLLELCFSAVFYCSNLGPLKANVGTSRSACVFVLLSLPELTCFLKVH